MTCEAIINPSSKVETQWEEIMVEQLEIANTPVDPQATRDFYLECQQLSPKQLLEEFTI